MLRGPLRALAGRRGSRRRRLGLLGTVGSVVVEAAAIRRAGYPLAGNVVVRCSDGHLFTTLWVPGASLKSLRLGPRRLQRCPVGGHWSVVSPVRRADLTPEAQRLAAASTDVRIP
jgi:hypothetical protein